MNVVAKEEWHRDVDNLNRVERYYLFVHDEREDVDVLFRFSGAVNSALTIEKEHATGVLCLKQI